MLRFCCQGAVAVGVQCACTGGAGCPGGPPMLLGSLPGSLHAPAPARAGRHCKATALRFDALHAVMSAHEAPTGSWWGCIQSDSSSPVWKGISNRCWCVDTRRRGAPRRQPPRNQTAAIAAPPAVQPGWHTRCLVAGSDTASGITPGRPPPQPAALWPAVARRARRSADSAQDRPLQASALPTPAFRPRAAPLCLPLPPHHLQPASSDPSKPQHHTSPSTMALFHAAAKAVALARGNPGAFRCGMGMLEQLWGRPGVRGLHTSVSIVGHLFTHLFTHWPALYLAQPVTPTSARCRLWMPASTARSWPPRWVPPPAAWRRRRCRRRRCLPRLLASLPALASCRLPASSPLRHRSLTPSPHTLTPPLQTSTLSYSRSCSARIGAVHEVAPLSSAADWPRLAEQEAPCTPAAPVWAARVTPSTASAAAPPTATPTPTVPTCTLLILEEAEDVLPCTPARPAPYLPPARRANASAATLAGCMLVLPTFAAPAPTPSPCYTPPAKRTAAQHAAAAAAPRPGRTCPFPSLTAGQLLPVCSPAPAPCAYLSALLLSLAA